MKNLLFIAFFIFGTTAASAQSKIAHLNSQEVMEAMPSYKSAVLKLETFQPELNTELQTMVADFEAAIEIYRKKEPDLSPVLKQFEEEKLAKKEQALNQREQSMQQEVEAYSRELNLPIIEIVEKAVKIVSDREKYDYVFDVNTLLVHNGPDITKSVITEILLLDTAP